MKYVMLETADGQKLPVIFPDNLVHFDVANVMGRLVDRNFGQLGGKRTVAASAGFVGLTKVGVWGESESLGSLRSNPLDGVRIMAGEAVSHMPDVLLRPIAGKMAEQDKDNKLLAAARMVELWWLADGMHMNNFNGAPACIFALRAALKEHTT